MQPLLTSQLTPQVCEEPEEAQLPAPSQLAGVYMRSSHMPVQGVPASGMVHAPPPLQVPFVPQPPTFRQKGYAVPAGRSWQAPAKLATLHFSQKPHESAVQQTPSVQKLPARHSLSTVQASPGNFLSWQVPGLPVQ